jgi:hypothetical protein
MDWSALPVDMEELIAAKLPLVALARLSSTRKVFKATFRRHLAREQDARCERPACIFGGGRIKCLAGLIKGFLKKEPLELYLSDGPVCNSYWVSEDGTCHAHGRGPPGGDTTPDVRVWVQFLGAVLGSKYQSRRLPESHSMHLSVLVESGKQMNLYISGKGGKSTYISMAPSKVDDEGVMLLQALLSEGLVQSLRDGSQRAAISITTFLPAPVLTPAEFRSLVGPLMPFISPSKGSVGTVVTGASMLSGSLGMWVLVNKTEQHPSSPCF